MKPKIYVSIALVLFAAILLVVFSAGFTQNKMLQEQAQSELQLRQELQAVNGKQENCTIVNIVMDGEIVMTINDTAPAVTPTPVVPVAPKPVTVVTPKPKPKPITRAS